MSASLASCAVSTHGCFVAGRRPSRRNRRSHLACTAAQNRPDEEQGTAQKLAAAGLAAILLASQPQVAFAKDAGVASQEDILTELLQKNGGKGIKLIKAPKQKQQLSPESSSPYSTPQQAPKPAPLSVKKSAPAPRQESFKSASNDKVKFSGPVRSGVQGEFPKGYEGSDASSKGKGAVKSAASSAKSAVQSALPSNPLQQKQDAQKAPQAAAPKPAFKNPLLERREAEEAAKKATSAVKSAAPDLPKIELPNPFKQSTPEKQPAAPKPAFKNPLLEKRDAEAAAKKAVSSVKEAAPPAPKFELPNVFDQKPKLPEAPSAPKAAFKNPLLEKRDAEATAKKAVSAVKEAAPEAPKFELPNVFEQKPKLPEAPSGPKPAFKNPLLEKRDAEAAANKAVSAVKEAVPETPKFGLPNVFEQKPKLPEAPSGPKPAFKNPLLEKRDAETAAKKAVSAVKEAVPEAPKFELPNLLEQKPKLPEVPAVPKAAFKNPLLEKRDAEAAAQKAISAVKDTVKEAPKLEAPKLELPKLELPSKSELPKPAPAQKPAFENPLLAKRKAEDALKSAASSASKIVPDNPLKNDASPLKAAAGAASTAGGAAAAASSGIKAPSLPSVSLPSLPSLGGRSATDTKEALGVLGAEVAAALLVSSTVGSITADVPRKKDLNR